MKSLSRFSVWVAFAALLCFASSAFGQSKVNVKVTNSRNSVLNSAPAGFLAFAFGPGGDHIIAGNRGGNNGGNQGGNGGSQNGCGSNQGWNDRVGGGRCTQVPEGGTALMYLLLAGLCCAAAMILRPQQAEVRETN
jgi:hypothetical protein